MTKRPLVATDEETTMRDYYERYDDLNLNKGKEVGTIS